MVEHHCGPSFTERNWGLRCRPWPEVTKLASGFELRPVGFPSLNYQSLLWSMNGLWLPSSSKSDKFTAALAVLEGVFYTHLLIWLLMKRALCLLAPLESESIFWTPLDPAVFEILKAFTWVCTLAPNLRASPSYLLQRFPKNLHTVITKRGLRNQANQRKGQWTGNQDTRKSWVSIAEVAAKRDNVNLGCITRSIVSKSKGTMHFLWGQTRAGMWG